MIIVNGSDLGNEFSRVLRHEDVQNGLLCILLGLHELVDIERLYVMQVILELRLKVELDNGIAFPIPSGFDSHL